MIKAWQKAFSSPIFKNLLVVFIVLWLILISQLDQFFAFIQQRKGILMDDFILANIPSANCSLVIFGLLYGLAVLFLFRVLNHPHFILKFVIGYFVIMVLRIITLYFVPLEPPAGLVLLEDPFSKYFYGGVVITKDLFFSGHTATCLLMYCILEKRSDKIIALIISILVMALLLVQHIHYSIDIAAAVIVTFTINTVLNKEKMRLEF